MEKSSVKSKNKFLKLLPRAAPVITFHSPPFSPNKEKTRSSSSEITCSTKPKTHLGKGSGSSSNATVTGPITSIIPAQARYSKSTSSSSFAFREPTSPKISCMGQIKHKKKMCKLYQKSLATPVPVEYIDQVLKFNNKSTQHELKTKQPVSEAKKKNARVLKPMRSFKNMFGGSRKSGANSSGGVDQHDDLSVKAPSLGQMSRFSSGRSALSSFDWTAAAQIAPVLSNDHGGGKDKISFAASAAGIHVIKKISECKDASLEPRKEINLWKRRTMPQPKPLQLSSC